MKKFNRKRSQHSDKKKTQKCKFDGKEWQTSKKSDKLV